MVDYTALLKKLTPDRDGEPHTYLRTGVVNAVNTNGTLDILMSSGVIVPGVPKLATAYAPNGATVQMISFRGSLLVIGSSGTSAANGPLTKTGAVTAGPSGTTSFTLAVNFGVTFPAAPSVHVNLDNGSATGWNGRAVNVSTTGFTLFGFGSSSSTFSASWQWTAIYAP
jgi:hypothetical protein